MKAKEFVFEKWSQKYKSSINCSHPKGFSQRAHCAGKNKHNESMEMEMVCEDCGMCETHGNINEIKKGAKDANGYTRCWPGKHAEGTKRGKNGGQVRNCVPNESVAEGSLNEFALGSGGGESGRWYTDDQLTDIVGDGWYNDLDVSGDIAKQEMIQQAQAWLDDQGYSIHVLNCKVNDDDMEWFIEGSFHNPRFAKPGVAEELSEEFDLIENIIEGIAAQNGVDAETVWTDLESLTEDELYAFAVTSQLNEDWQKANKRDRTAGMSQKAVNAYRRENPGSKLKTAVTTKPSKLKRGSKASKRRKSYCSRSRGQMKMHSISCAKTPDKAICKARRRWNC